MRNADGVPDLTTGRVTLERIGARAQLVVSTSRPISDPLLRLTLQAGCDNAVRREYMLLLDPAPIETPIVAAVAPPKSDTAAPVTAAPPARTNAGTPTTTGASGGAAATARVQTRRPREPRARRPSTVAGSNAASTQPAGPAPQ